MESGGEVEVEDSGMEEVEGEGEEEAVEVSKLSPGTWRKGTK